VSINSLEQKVKELDGEIEFTKLAEAREYHETLAIKEKESNKRSVEEVVSEKYPETI